MAGSVPSSSSNQIPNSSLMPGSILFPSFGDPMIDVHLSQMQGVVGHVPQSTTTTGGGDGGGNNGTTPPLDYGGFPPNGNGQGAGRRQLNLAEEDLRMIHTMMRMRMTTTKEMKKTRKKKRKKTIEHGGDEGDQEIIERSRMTDRESRGKRPREYLFRPGQRSINLIPGRCNC